MSHQSPQKTTLATHHLYSMSKDFKSQGTLKDFNSQDAAVGSLEYASSFNAAMSVCVEPLSGATAGQASLLQVDRLRPRGRYAKTMPGEQAKNRTHALDVEPAGTCSDVISFSAAISDQVATGACHLSNASSGALDAS
eukprot:7693479-Karenia_brevis.AAC.1